MNVNTSSVDTVLKNGIRSKAVNKCPIIFMNIYKKEQHIDVRNVKQLLKNLKDATI